MKIIAGVLTLTIVVALGSASRPALQWNALARPLSPDTLAERDDGTPACRLLPGVADLERHGSCTRWP